MAQEWSLPPSLISTFSGLPVVKEKLEEAGEVVAW
jgi:hypothetical protein